MTSNNPLNPLPFDEAWQAEVFALTVHLNESGVFTWHEWGRVFGAALKQAGGDCPIEGGGDYYRVWLDALGGLLDGLGHAKSTEIAVMKQRWIDAYERTPHGHPVLL